MGKKIVVQTYDAKQRDIAARFYATQKFFTSRGIELKLETFSGSDTADDIAAKAKKAEFVAELDGRRLRVRLEYTSKKIELANVDLDAEPHVGKRRAAMRELLKVELVDKAA